MKEKTWKTPFGCERGADNINLCAVSFWGACPGIPRALPGKEAPASSAIVSVPNARGVIAVRLGDCPSPAREGIDKAFSEPGM